MSSQQLRNYAALRYTVEELANELEACIQERYYAVDCDRAHHALKRDCRQDMEAVEKARKLLEDLS